MFVSKSLDEKSHVHGDSLDKVSISTHHELEDGFNKFVRVLENFMTCFYSITRLICNSLSVS